jgi:adenylate kinase
MDAGKLVPDEVIIGVVTERLAEADCAKGFILDGVPRTIPQAEALDRAGIAFDHVISLEIPDELIVERMSGRRVCVACGAPFHITNNPPKAEGVCDSCGAPLQQRNDDKPEVVHDRLKVYYAETAPLKSYYEKRGLLVSVDNRTTPDVTFKAILSVLGL